MTLKTVFVDCVGCLSAECSVNMKINRECAGSEWRSWSVAQFYTAIRVVRQIQAIGKLNSKAGSARHQFLHTSFFWRHPCIWIRLPIQSRMAHI